MILRNTEETDEQKFTENVIPLNANFKVVQKKGATKMKLTFADGECKEKSVLLDFIPETVKFHEGRRLDQ